MNDIEKQSKLSFLASDMSSTALHLGRLSDRIVDLFQEGAETLEYFLGDHKELRSRFLSEKASGFVINSSDELLSIIKKCQAIGEEAASKLEALEEAEGKAKTCRPTLGEQLKACKRAIDDILQGDFLMSAIQEAKLKSLKKEKAGLEALIRQASR